MTKLEVGKEYWFKGRVEEVDVIDENMPYRVKFGGWTTLWLPASSKVVEVIPEREKVTIPKEVADWIEEHKEQFSTVYTAFRILVKRDYGIKKWVNENQDNFARAWLDGYEIEEEPLGVLLVDMPALSFWKYYFLYSDKNGCYDILGLDETKGVVERKMFIKATEAEAKEKYPNFKWVSLEELENE